MALDLNVQRGNQRLRRPAASARLKDVHGVDYKPSTLAKLACIGGGPPMEYAGRVPLYRIDWLDEWARSKISPRVSSTSEHKALRSGARAA